MTIHVINESPFPKLYPFGWAFKSFSVFSIIITHNNVFFFFQVQNPFIC